MAEHITIGMKKNFEVRFWMLQGDGSEAELVEVFQIHTMNPYSLMLAGLGTCTAIVLLTYAQNHQIPLDEVQIRLKYDRVLQEDCANCENIDEYTEAIEEWIEVTGALSDGQRQRLLAAAHFCPVYQQYTKGIPIETHLHMLQ